MIFIPRGAANFQYRSDVYVDVEILCCDTIEYFINFNKVHEKKANKSQRELLDA